MRTRPGGPAGLSMLLTLLLVGCVDPAPRYPGPRTPEQAVEDFQISDAFRVEVFAAEPHVVDPVSLVFDAQGRAFAVEMRDYPYPPEPGQERSRIRLLEDSDGDGRVDRSTVFAEGLSEATSVLPWKDGLLVTAAPDILYLRDADGDGVADERRVVFTGFFTGNAEAQITNLRFGIDNWIYAANTGNPGEVTYARRPGSDTLSLRGADFRFRLDRDRYERAAGYAQFGQDMDDWGHRFVTHNTLHLRHVVLPEPYLGRNRHLPPAAALQNVSDHDPIMFQQTPPPYWRAVRTERRNARYRERQLDRVEYAEDHFTGSSGGTVYAGGRFGPAFEGNVFTGEVAGNLVHRDVLRPDGASFVAGRAPGEEEREFLAATDPWFRPANLAVGPDGYLYVVDMYRQHIETPLSIPEDLQADMDFLAGDTLGRIYRIVPAEAAPVRERPRLGAAPVHVLVEHLSHPNRWWRLTAQRLLLERQDAAAVPLLRDVASNAERPQARLHAAYALEGLDALGEDLVRRMAADPHPGVREHGLRLAERDPSLLPVVAAGVDDASPRVVFQAALSLGAFSGPPAETALAQVAARHGGDPWFRRAVLSSETGASLGVLEALANDHGFFEAVAEGPRRFLHDLSAVVGARARPPEVTRLLRLLAGDGVLGARDAWRVAGLSGLAEGAEGAEVPPLEEAAAASLEHLQQNGSDEVRSAAGAVAARFASAAGAR